MKINIYKKIILIYIKMSVLVDKPISEIPFVNSNYINNIPIKIKKCNYKGCKEIMDLANRVQCNKCQIYHCMFHRVYEAHNCKVFLEEQKKQENSLVKEREKLIKQNNLLKELANKYIK